VTRTRDYLHVKAKLFRGLADPSRLAILEALRDGRKSVSQVVDRTGLSQPNASMHLECLWCCGLVEREMAGRFTFYWIGSRKMKQVLAAAENALEEVFDRIDECRRYEERKVNG
jgi:DNA-binding transcriptional ArsR family regulator